MRIWIDGQCLQTASRLRGIGRYTLSLIKQIVEQNPNFDITISLSTAMPNEAIIAQRLLSEFINEDSILFWQPTKIEPEAISGYNHQRKVSEIALALHVDMINPDVVLSMSPFEGAYDLAVPYNPIFKNNQKIVQIFYDAIPERYPKQYFGDSGYKKMYFRRKKYYEICDMVLSISDFTNSEADKLFEGVKSHPIYAGVDKALYEKANRLSEPEQNYDLLYVGALDYRKNVIGLVKAIGEISKTHKKSKSFAVVGFYDQDGKDQIRQLWKSLDLAESNLHFIGKVDDDELLQCYQSAKVVVQPSLMEGFGLTALEAILTGTCVAGSRDTALQEIIKDERALFSPLDSNEMAEVLVNLTENSVLRREVLAVQKNSLTQFTWEKSAELAIRYIKEIELTPKVFDLNKVRELSLSRLINVNKIRKINHLPEILAANERQLSNRPPILGIDITETARHNQGTGIQRVVCKTVENVGKSLERTDFNHTLLFCNDWLGWRDVGKKITKLSSRHENFVAQSGDTLLLLDSSWEFYSMHHNALWDARFKGVNIISCLYDTVPLRFISFSGQAMGDLFARWFCSALTYSSGFICISKAVADELYEILESIDYPNELKIGYWHLGTDFTSSKLQPQSLNKEMAKKKTVSILMVGTIEPRKAHSVALSAFEEIWRNPDLDIELVIVGKIGWASVELTDRLENHAELGNRLTVKNRVSDEELSELYTNCDALLACSYAEGFGLPIVEAGQMGKPVIASDIPVFREVAKSAPATFFFKVGCSSALKDAVLEFSKTPTDWLNRSIPDWLNWQESTDQLVNVITNDNWYCHYKPKESTSIKDSNYIGRTFMTEILDNPQQNHQIEFLEDEPTFDEHGDLVLTVIISNLSDIIFSGEKSIYNAKHCPIEIKFTTKSNSDDDSELKPTNIELPFPIMQDSSVFYPLRVSKEKLPNGSFMLNVKISQVGGLDWGPGVSMYIDK